LTDEESSDHSDEHDGNDEDVDEEMDIQWSDATSHSKGSFKSHTIFSKGI
jgi:uncharacterized protein YjaG (DUF416 family)